MEKIEIRKILNQKYNRENWKSFTKKIFNNVEYFKSPKSIKTNNDKILDFVQIGNLKLDNQKNVALFELRLIKNLNIYKNKIELRNIVTKFIDQYSNHGVLVVFDNQGSDYRLTFSSKYSEFDENGNIIEIETSSKRYTYLLGENESCATAAERFHLLHKQKKNIKINDLLDAFNVDKITDEFFITYKKLYLKMYDEIEELKKKDKNIGRTFQKNKISNEEFAKKFLGQLVFLYFVQKKGWLGLKKDKTNIFEKWGKGDKNFIRNLFEKKYCKYENFFNDVLEPLFAAFSTDLPENYYSKLDTKIPFLNGGLFDPIKNYDWLDTKINISNSLIGEILDNFEMYNFTIQEEDPEEKEVAIDPEMLGKVFENLLEIKDKKSKGTFYTPRKIAKYICEESLTNYLSNNFKDVKKDIFEKIINNVEEKNLQSFLSKNYENIDEKLKDIKICDPAVGSGEFPVELMNLCVSLRLKLNEFFNNKKRTSYNMKRHFINNSIYGVDIEDSAIETAKLRLWLSLILDEDNYENIQPLPNLDYKIFKGNSLLKIDANSLFDDFNSKDLIKLKNEYFNIHEIKKKNIYKKKIQDKFIEILGTEDSFDIQIIFEEVFKSKGGFDIILGNPPYVPLQDIKDNNLKKKYQRLFKSYHGYGDLYCLFIEKSSNLINEKGVVSLITSNKWIRAIYGEPLRNYLKDNNRIISFIDFKSVKIFKTADVDTSIIVYTKEKFDDFKFLEINSKSIYLDFITKKNNIFIPINTQSLKERFWILSNEQNTQLFFKIYNEKNILKFDKNRFRSGIKTGMIDAFVVDTLQKNIITKSSKKENKIFKKILRGSSFKRYTFEWEDYWLINSHGGYKEFSSINLEKDFPKTFNHVKKFETKLKKRTDKVIKWTNLRSCAYLDEFDLPKVAWMGMNRSWKFSYIPEDYIMDNTISFLADKEYAKFLVGIYSSKLHRWFFKQIGTMFDDGGFMCKVDTVSQFPIKKPTKDEKYKIEKYVDKMITKYDQKFDDEINEIVMKMYNLTESEKKIIRND